MSRPKELLIDIGVTIVVFIVATLLLGNTNYRNNQQNLGVTYRELDSETSLYDTDHQSSILVIDSPAELSTNFPEFNQTIDWEHEVVLAYIEYPQPTTGYRLETQMVERQGSTLTVDYQLLLPPLDSFNLTVVTQPVLLIALQKTSLVSEEALIIRFHNQITNQTTSLSLAPHEID